MEYKPTDAMQGETLVPLTDDANRIVCDFPGCGKSLSKGGMGRHRAAHERRKTQTSADQVVERLRTRVRNHFTRALEELEKAALEDALPAVQGRIDLACTHICGAQADLEILGVISL